MPGQADILEMENALLRQELNDAQAIESQLKGRLVQIDTAAMVHINAGMRTTVACLRQRGVRFVLALFNCPDTFLWQVCTHAINKISRSSSAAGPTSTSKVFD